MIDNDLAQSACNIARSLSIVGDRWSLLILYELSMGSCRFDGLRVRTGISSHLLAGRLKRLEEDGVLERRVYCNRPARYEYSATAKGQGLDDVLLALRRWGLRWQVLEKDPATTTKRSRTRPLAFNAPAWNAPLGEMFSFDNCVLVQARNWKAEREANLEKFLASRLNARR